MKITRKLSLALMLINAFPVILNICNAETIEDYICIRKFKGCRVDYRRRGCLEEEAVGCRSPFPYDNLYECLKDFYGQSNVCEQLKPCRNNGVCSPITTDNHVRTFRCECSTTGFYGDHCERECPTDFSAKDPRTLPCIQI